MKKEFILKKISVDGKTYGMMTHNDLHRGFIDGLNKSIFPNTLIQLYKTRDIATKKESYILARERKCSYVSIDNIIYAFYSEDNMETWHPVEIKRIINDPFHYEYIVDFNITMNKRMERI